MTEYAPRPCQRMPAPLPSRLAPVPTVHPQSMRAGLLGGTAWAQAHTWNGEAMLTCRLSNAIVQCTLLHTLAQGALDDAIYAKLYVSSKWRQSKRGPLLLRQVRCEHTVGPSPLSITCCARAHVCVCLSSEGRSLAWVGFLLLCTALTRLEAGVWWLGSRDQGPAARISRVPLVWLYLATAGLLSIKASGAPRSPSLPQEHACTSTGARMYS